MSLESELNNNWIYVTMYLFLFLYIALSNIALPPIIIKLFENNIFRFVFLGSILLIDYNKAPHVVHLIAGTYIATIFYIYKHKHIYEHYNKDK